MVKALEPHFRIDLYCDNPDPMQELINEFSIYPVSVFPKLYDNYDEVIYQLGNNCNFHKRIYELAWNFPGTIVLHDYDLSGFLFESFYQSNGGKLYEQALLEGYGDEGGKALQTILDGHALDRSRFPMSHAIVGKSKRTIVHHRWVRDQFPASRNIVVIPHFARLNYRPTVADVEEFKSKFGIKDNRQVVCCLGFINRNKLPHLQIKVVQRLVRDGYPVQLVFAGEPASDLKLFDEIDDDSLKEIIIITGYLNEKDYFSAIFASDVIINLRNPTMGEASGTLMHALAAAKPTILSDVNQYKEFPDKVCWKVTHDEHEAELLYEYLKALLSDRNLRAAISANSSQYVESVLDFAKITAQWAQMLSG
ncbi:MAG TPA: glycosyltransferase family 4 protein [Pyrinomonadaceae bacterium]|nr:glycosyltransferase family 4 protein [Pyrinomonadaceae bacterium]